MRTRREVIQSLVDALPDDLRALFDDPAEVKRIRDRLEPLLSSRFYMLLVGPPGSGFDERHDGIEGFIAGWDAWTKPYERYIFEPGAIEEIGDVVVAEGRQWAHLPGAAEATGLPDVAALWFWDGDEIDHAEFHLDRELAYRIARASAGNETDLAETNLHER